MNFIEKDTYTIEDIQSLIDIQAEENTYYEFKDARAIDDKQKAEISKDVSAFANADGGVIIYGLNEDRNTHKAVGLSFVDTLPSELPEIPVATREQSGVLCFSPNSLAGRLFFGLKFWESDCFFSPPWFWF